MLKVFGQKRKSLRKKSANEEKVLRIITALSCVVRKVSAVGRSDKRPKMENQSAVGGLVHARRDERGV